MQWPYDKRAEPTHAWGTIGAGLVLLVGVPGVLATLHSADQHFRWWWPTNWMFAPVAILAVGLVLLVVPVLRSGAISADTPVLGLRPGHAEGAAEEAPTPPKGAPESQSTLVVAILEVTWELWRRRVLIVTVLAKVTNTTDKVVRLEATGLVGDEGSGYLDWLRDDHISAPDKAALALGCFSKCTLTGNTEVAPYGDLVGVFCGAVSRSTPFGGTPALTLTVHDVIGNQYTARIEEQNPKIYSLPGQ